MPRPMTDPDVLTPAEGDLWSAALAEVQPGDVYHLAAYHELAERTGDGTARLIVYRHDGATVLLPFLLRPAAEVEGLEGEPWSDAGSVYGYAGPLASSADLPPATIVGFHDAVRGVMRDLRVATIFSSLHPLLEQTPLLTGVGEVVTHGTTVSIDLTHPEDVQVARYRQNHRRDLRRLRALGANCVVERPADLDDFLGIYHETMSRVGAAPRYFFDQAYFNAMHALLADHIWLARCTLEGQLIAAGLFLSHGRIVQYHLGATRDAFLSLGPMKIVVDTVRHWASEAGYGVLHLGGGIGAREDSLFHFKAGFTERRHPFRTFRWVIDEEAYAHLASRKADWNASRGLADAGSGHFPVYRSPVGPVSTPGTD